MADVVVSGTPVVAATVVPTKSYKLKPGRVIIGADGVGQDNVIQLTDSQAHAFRDKLESSDDLVAAIAKVTGVAAPLKSIPDQIPDTGKVNKDGTSTPAPGTTHDKK